MDPAFFFNLHNSEHHVLLMFQTNNDCLAIAGSSEKDFKAIIKLYTTRLLGPSEPLGHHLNKFQPDLPRVIHSKFCPDCPSVSRGEDLNWSC